MSLLPHLLDNAAFARRFFAKENECLKRTEALSGCPLTDDNDRDSVSVAEIQEAARVLTGLPFHCRYRKMD